jgi:hypothetical protein
MDDLIGDGIFGCLAGNKDKITVSMTSFFIVAPPWTL